MIKLCVVAMCCLATAAVANAAEPRVTQVKPDDPPITLGKNVQPLNVPHIGPFVQLPDSGLLCVRGDSAFISRDGGATWETKEKIWGDLKLNARPEQGLIRLKDGTIVLVFIDNNVRNWKWDDEKGTAPDAKLYVWSARSTDNGQTWTDIHRIQDGYSGAIRDIIETSDGKLVCPVQKFLPEQGRHATIPHYSTDGGKTWTATRVLDVGGRGHHDGALEATLVELKDKRLWLLLRTNLDFFYESYSTDGGMTWTDPAKTAIAASSAPAMLKRLASGRLVLLWNRLGPEGAAEVKRRPGGTPRSAAAASWFRAELSIAFSDDDGTTWTAPTVIATKPGKQLSYPYVLEAQPGQLWITTMQGALRAKLNEADFTK